MIKYVLSILLLAFFSVSSLEAQNHVQWVKVKDTISAYIVEFPSEPKKGAQDVPTAKGDLVMESYTGQSSDENFIYMSSFTRYPESFFENGLDTFEAQNEVLTGCVNGAVRNTKGTLVKDKKIIFNGYPGRNIQIEIKYPGVASPYTIEMKVVLVGYDLYLTQIICEKPNVGNVNAKKFFESFELINVKH